MKIIKVLLCAFGVAIIAISWFFLLNTSYDWVSSASNWKAIAGSLILLMMAGVALAAIAVAVAFIARGVKHLWLE